MNRSAIRRAVMDRMVPESAAVFVSNVPAVLSRDTEHPYRPNSDLLYVTGFEEPNCVAVLRPGQEPEFAMFVQAKDKKLETWTGRRYGPEGVKSSFGVEEAFTIDELHEKLPELLSTCRTVYYPLSETCRLDMMILSAYRDARGLNRKKREPIPTSIVELGSIVHELRKLKTPAEIELLKASGKLCAGAQKEAIMKCRPGMFEYQIDAILQHAYLDGGATGYSFPAICAGGDNATILHYGENSDELKDGDLLLVDSGCAVEYYASDITRTYPINGKFSESQKRVYEIVLRAEKAGIEALRIGGHVRSAHDTATMILAQGLVDLGILEGDVDKIIEEKEHESYCLHGVSHFLGIDTHDVGHYRDKHGEALPLEAGMVLTVEPGLYFCSDDEAVPEEYRGIGIRIEDDVLITDDGPVVMSADVPKSIKEIEELMAR